jgi:hypothetical protein
VANVPERSLVANDAVVIVALPNRCARRLAHSVVSISGMELVIAHLHHIGFAEPRAWSKIQIDPANGQPVRILTKWIRR